jgi:transposase-like protein
MANLEEFEKLTKKERQNRYFSEDFKKRKVKEIEKGIVKVSEVCRAYQVSNTAVYRWMRKYSLEGKAKTRLVVEYQSDTVKLLELRNQLKELEQTVGKKQIKLEFLEKMIELAEEEYGIDIKKKFTTKPLPGSGKNEKRTRTK